MMFFFRFFSFFFLNLKFASHVVLIVDILWYSAQPIPQHQFCQLLENLVSNMAYYVSNQALNSHQLSYHLCTTG